jgi:hypothetical protein
MSARQADSLRRAAIVFGIDVTGISGY